MFLRFWFTQTCLTEAAGRDLGSCSVFRTESPQLDPFIVNCSLLKIASRFIVDETASQVVVQDPMPAQTDKASKVFRLYRALLRTGRRWPGPAHVRFIFIPHISLNLSPWLDMGPMQTTRKFLDCDQNFIRLFARGDL